MRRKILFLAILTAVSFCISVDAEEVRHTKAIADRINVRARPEVNSEIVTQLKLDEDVIILGEEGEWTKIAAPMHSKCWVNIEGIENNIITKNSVNLRCGPGLAFPVLITLKKGTKINIVETFNEWVRIDPPIEFGVWVNSKYLESGKKAQEKEEKEQPKDVSETTVAKEETETSEPAEEQKPIEPVIIPETPKVISVPNEEIAGVELASYAGRLQDMGVIINRPGTYKLLSDSGKWICILKSPTLDLNPYVNRIVRVEGVVLSRTSSWGAPVIELKKLSVIK